MRGPVRLLTDARGEQSVTSGDILVIEHGRAASAATVARAGALVIELGGMLSGLATLARELGVPTVVGVANATCLLREGEAVEVDADRGTVTRTEHSSPGPQGDARARLVPR